MALVMHKVWLFCNETKLIRKWPVGTLKLEIAQSQCFLSHFSDKFVSYQLDLLFLNCCRLSRQRHHSTSNWSTPMLKKPPLRTPFTTWVRPLDRMWSTARRFWSTSENCRDVNSFSVQRWTNADKLLDFRLECKTFKSKNGASTTDDIFWIVVYVAFITKNCKDSEKCSPKFSSIIVYGARCKTELYHNRTH